MSGHIQDDGAQRHDERPLPWLFGIVGLSVLGWGVLAVVGYALVQLAIAMAG